MPPIVGEEKIWRVSICVGKLSCGGVNNKGYLSGQGERRRARLTVTQHSKEFIIFTASCSMLD
jgi:hypothetical protein